MEYNYFSDEHDEMNDAYDEYATERPSIEEVIGHPLHEYNACTRTPIRDSYPTGYVTSLMEGTFVSPMDGSDKGVCTLGELLDRPSEDIPFLIAPFLQRSGVAMLAGSSDTGKSSFLRQLALSIALGNSTFLGFPIKAVHHSAICVSTEDNGDAIVPLLKKQLSGQSVPKEARDRLRFVFNTESLLFTLESLLTRQPADVVIIDALGDLFEGNLNQSNEVRRFLNSYNQLAIKHNCLIIFMHHTGKRTEDQKPSKNNILGSQGLEAKMRIVLELRTDPYDSQLRHLCILKGNYLPHELKNKSYVLRFDENLIFHNTGERILFGEISKYRDADSDNSNGNELLNRAKKLLEDGCSFEQAATLLLPIAEELKVKPLSKSALARRFPKSTLDSATQLRV